MVRVSDTAHRRSKGRSMKSWNDRLNAPGINGVRATPRTMADVVEGQPTVRQDDDFIRSIPKGVEMDVRALRTALALEHGAEVTCPVTIGYHLRTVAEPHDAPTLGMAHRCGGWAARQRHPAFAMP